MRWSAFGCHRRRLEALSKAFALLGRDTEPDALDIGYIAYRDTEQKGEEREQFWVLLPGVKDR
eukprot:12900394-Prorocentrum_lima.AAC.1